MKYLIGTGLVLGIALLVFVGFQGLPVLGSVGDEGVYNYTRITNSNASTSPQIIKAKQGVLGSIVVSSTTVGTLNVYDGTVMDVKLLTGSSTYQTFSTTTATTTIAHMGASVAAGTYTFDVAFTDNLVILPSTDFYGSYTITWR